MIRIWIETRTARLMDLKDRGYKIIDSLVLSGMRRDVVYKKLRKGLKAQQSEHFSWMNTVEEAERAVAVLERIRANRISCMKDHECKLHECDRLRHAQARVEIGLATKKESKHGVGVVVRNDLKQVILPLEEQRKAYALLAARKAQREMAQMSTPIP